MNDADITILGAGPVGSALALLLARATREPGRITLCRVARAAPAAAAAPPGGPDPRALALNHGSRLLLESVGAWPSEGAPIRHVHVSQKGRLGRTLIDHAEFGVPELGTVLGYGQLQGALDAALRASGVTERVAPEGARVVAEDGQGVTLALAGVQWRSSVVVRAEGGTFDEQQAGDLHRRYAQHAVLATVSASRPQPGWAWERFTREGPLALLPHPQSPHSYSLVWCCSPARAAALVAGSDAAFNQGLTDLFGDRLGALTVQGARHVFPLGLNMVRQPVQGRCVVIGNAAQALHPVAGQGLNLGLRDAARLAQSLAPMLRASSAPHRASTAGAQDPVRIPEHDATLAHGLTPVLSAAPQPDRALAVATAPIDPTVLLAGYARACLADRWLTAGLTDLLPRVFATGFAPVEHACGLALLALDVLAPLRSPLARHLMLGLRR